MSTPGGSTAERIDLIPSGLTHSRLRFFGGPSAALTSRGNKGEEGWKGKCGEAHFPPDIKIHNSVIIHIPWGKYSIEFELGNMFYRLNT